MTKPGDAALSAFGEYLRTQRRLAKLTLRELSELTNVSNPYLSQVERGLHRPSVQVLTALAKELDQRGIVLLLGGGHGRFREVLYRSGLADLIGRERIFINLEGAFAAAEAMRNASSDADVQKRGTLLGKTPA